MTNPSFTSVGDGFISLHRIYSGKTNAAGERTLSKGWVTTHTPTGLIFPDNIGALTSADRAKRAAAFMDDLIAKNPDLASTTPHDVVSWKDADGKNIANRWVEALQAIEAGQGIPGFDEAPAEKKPPTRRPDTPETTAAKELLIKALDKKSTDSQRENLQAIIDNPSLTAVGDGTISYYRAPTGKTSPDGTPKLSSNTWVVQHSPSGLSIPDYNGTLTNKTKAQQASQWVSDFFAAHPEFFDSNGKTTTKFSSWRSPDGLSFGDLWKQALEALAAGGELPIVPGASEAPAGGAPAMSQMNLFDGIDDAIEVNDDDEPYEVDLDAEVPPEETAESIFDFNTLGQFGYLGED